MEIGKLSTRTNQIVSSRISLRLSLFTAIPYIILPHCCECDIAARHLIFCSIYDSAAIVPTTKFLSVHSKQILWKCNRSSFRHIFPFRNCSKGCLVSGLKCYLEFRQNREIDDNFLGLGYLSGFLQRQNDRSLNFTVNTCLGTVRRFCEHKTVFIRPDSRDTVIRNYMLNCLKDFISRRFVRYTHFIQHIFCCCFRICKTLSGKVICCTFLFIAGLIVFISNGFYFKRIESCLFDLRSKVIACLSGNRFRGSIFHRIFIQLYLISVRIFYRIPDSFSVSSPSYICWI